ncbi:hypothetical protein [Bacillus aerolatus]|uniref:hypothetical protein n=1 Tax=Bacillus aerolatus TaxID=2653354 RepID=UPI001CDC13AF|nr:hypothetical protein [Bacillus aerolatus]
MINVYEREGVICVEGSNGKSGHKGRTVYVFLVDGMLIDTGFKHIIMKKQAGYLQVT